MFPVVVFWLASRPLPAADDSAAEVRAVRVEQPPLIDGILDDEAWERAAKITEFRQREPNVGAPASEPTEVYVAYDSHHLYFAFRCWDSQPHAITAKELARDADLSQDDRVQIILDTFLDHRTGFWFQIGPRGSIGDALIGDNGAVLNKDWDTLWAGKARIHEGGWDAEVVIPFQSISFMKGREVWGLKLIRHIKRLEESDYWPTANLDSYRFQISDAGRLVGLTGLEQGRGLDLRPYLLGGLHRREDGTVYSVSDAGLDAFYRLGPALQAALTLNTDFAETEADARRTNLTRFPLFFPEKRDFFLDGASYFTFGANRSDLLPFFSRRLGLNPEGEPIPVLGGAKVAGQVGRWNLGFLSVAEDRPEDRRVYGVARVRRNWGRESSVGFLGTVGNALGTEENGVVGLDLRWATSRFRGTQNLALVAFGLWSETGGRTGGDGAFGALVSYPNDRIEAEVGFQEIGDRFRPGIGFVPRRGIRKSFGEFAFQPRPGKWNLRQLSLGIEFEYITDLENRLLTRSVEVRPVGVRLDSGDELFGEVQLSFERLDEPFQIHPDYTIPVGIYRFVDYRLGLETARRRRQWLALESSWGAFYNGRRRGWELAAGWKVAVPLYLSAEFERDRVFLPGGDFTADVSRIVANILFRPDVTWYNFIQYDNFSETLGWQSRFYWILKPGNEIIFVWNGNVDRPWDQPKWAETDARFKLNYNFRF